MPPGLTARDGGRWLASADASGTYGVAVADAAGSSVAPDVDGAELTLGEGETVLMFAAPEAAVGALAAHAVPLTGTQIEYDVDGDTAWTRIHYKTEGGPTVFAAMPHHGQSATAGGAGEASQVGEIESIWGPLRLHVGTTLTSGVPTLEPATDLDVTELGDQARAGAGRAADSRCEGDRRMPRHLPPTPTSAARPRSATPSCTGSPRSWPTPRPSRSGRRSWTTSTRG